VVGEAMVAFVLADAYRRKFGGDHIEDVRQSLEAYEQRIDWRRRGA
jgi:chorismate synthase